MGLFVFCMKQKSLTEKKTTIEQVHDNVVNDLIKKHDSQLHALQGSCNEFQLQIEEKEINQGKLQQQLEDAKNSEISHVEIYHKSEIEIGELRKQLEDYKVCHIFLHIFNFIHWHVYDCCSLP